MAGLFAVVTWPAGAFAHPRPAGALLDQLLALRPRARWEEELRLEVPGGAAGVFGPAGTIAGPRRSGPSEDPALDTTIAAAGAEGGRVAAVVAEAGAQAAAARLLAPAPAGGEPLLPRPHAAVSWDGIELVAHLDPLGAWPLYLRRLPDGIALGTAALPLARLSPTCDLDPEGVAELVAFGQLVGTRTLYAGVDALPPGARRSLAATATRSERFRLEDEPATHRSLAAAADSILAALDAAVAATPASPAPGLLLSGGVDSRLLLALLVRHGHAARAYTFGQPGCADERYARRAAQAVGVPHRVWPLRPEGLAGLLDHAVALTDGHVSAVHFHGTDLLPELRQEATAEWNGFAGDAILGGSFAHPRYGLPGPPALEARLFAAFNRILRPAELGRVLAEPAAAELRDHPRAALKAALEAAPAGPAAERARHFLLDQRVGRLAAAGLALDRHYLPVVTPYAHAPVLEVMRRLRLAERRYGRALCHVLVRRFPRLAAIPWERTGARPGAPWWLATAVRAGWRLAARSGLAGARGPALADYAVWLTGPLASLRARLLRSPSLRDRPLFSAAGLDRLAAAPVRSREDVALAGVLMAMAAAAELLDGARAAPGELEPALE